MFSSEKCVFWGTSLRFLGHLVSDGTIKPDPQCSVPFLKFPIPSSLKQLEHFIRLAVYHVKWVPCFSRIMDPLFSTLQKKSLPLSLAARNAISQIKQAMNRAILYIVDPDEPLTLSTDASANAIGAILSQEGRPVAYMSQRLSPTRRHWPPAELEGYVVRACQQFRHYLANQPFTILCDQNEFVQALSCTSMKGVKNAKFAVGILNFQSSILLFDICLGHSTLLLMLYLV